MGKQWWEETPKEFADGFTEERQVHGMTEDTLYPSSNSGRYQVGREEQAPDLTSGAACEIYLNGTWTPGHIEHAPMYVVERSVKSNGIASGYYFISRRDGSVCGLCVGMRVRI